MPGMKGHFFICHGNRGQSLFEMGHKSKNEDDLELG